MKHKKGKVYIIGAGPGDPGLITVNGLKVLQKADCILYDFLSNLKLLDYSKKSCRKICVGKRDGLHLKKQTQINKLLLKASRKYAMVVRLKGGDPFVFSRGYEEIKYLKEKGVYVEIIPGITSAFAGPESFGLPLTIKNKISSLAVVTGRKHDKEAPIDAPSCDTLIYLMAVGNISNVVKALRKSGRSDNMPCAFIERATYDNARLVRATIGSVVKKVTEAKLVPPAVLIVGKALKT